MPSIQSRLICNFLHDEEVLGPRLSGAPAEDLALPRPRDVQSVPYNLDGFLLLNKPF